MGLTQAERDELGKVAKGLSGGGVAKYWRPKPIGNESTSYRIRILPGSGSIQAIARGRTHYFPTGVGGTCPAFFDEECAACQTFFDRLDEFRAKRDDPKPLKERWDLFRSLAPKHRIYLNVYVYEEERVLIWSLPADKDTSFGPALIKEVLEWAEAGADATDPRKGRDVTITLDPRGNFFAYSASFAKRPSVFKVEGWEEQLHELEDVATAKILTEEEIREAIGVCTGETPMKSEQDEGGPTGADVLPDKPKPKPRRRATKKAAARKR